MDNQLKMDTCECENKCHFSIRADSPNQNPGHIYGKMFASHSMSTIKTPYGTFTICKDCKNDCHKDIK